MSTQAAPRIRQSRRPYTSADYRYLVQHYREQSAPVLAAHLGRTVGSLYGFIADHPELRKQGKL
jgi:hypothetical protein